MIEDLAVLHHGDLPVVADKGLVAAADVDDGQAPVADGHTARGRVPDALIVRAAVHEALRHRAQDAVLQRLARAIPVAEDAAHGSGLPPGRAKEGPHPPGGQRNQERTGVDAHQLLPLPVRRPSAHAMIFRSNPTDISRV